MAEPASRLLSDALPLLPRTFEPTYRNPCWRCALPDAKGGASAGRLCCLPAVHVLGVSKCGTTDLYARLALHPLVLATANKGPHFWDE